MSKSIVAIFAHPDDEILACGASLAKHALSGATIRILLLATGLAARGPAASSATDELRNHARRAAETIGAKSVEFGDFPDNRMDTVPLLDVIQAIEEFLGEKTPDILYTHHDGDLNIDHQVVQRAVLTACRPVPGRGAHEIRSCEINSSTEWNSGFPNTFVPNMYEPVSNTIDRKVKALECYTGEIQEFPHPRSAQGVRTLATLRGMECGVESAEAFALARRVTAD